MGTVNHSVLRDGASVIVNYDETTLALTTADMVGGASGVRVTINDDTKSWTHTQDANTQATVTITESFVVTIGVDGDTRMGTTKIVVNEVG
jgi:hypothetical protein